MKMYRYSMTRIIFLLSLILTGMATAWGQKDSLPDMDSILKNETVYPLQFSFVHPIGSNGPNNVNVYNTTSINALVGRSKGVVGTEISGLVSLNTHHAIGFKGSGIADIVGGGMIGFQAGGIMTTVGASSKGFQAGGILATTGGNLKGFQVGGIVAVTGGNVKGLQAGGIVATAESSVEGFQAAGIIATTGDTMKGFQAGGIASITRGNVDGMQAAGIVNIARHLKGLQVGLINIADSIDDKSIQIGLVNIVRKGGIRRFGLMNTEFMNATLFMKSGTRWFHGYVGFGSQLHNRDYRFATMLGIGTIIRLTNRLSVEPGWMQWFVFQKGQLVYRNRTTEIQQLRTIFNFTAGKKGPHINAGPTINLGYTSFKNSSGEVGIDFAPSYFYNKTFTRSQVNVRAWIGYSVAISMGR